LKKKEKNRNKNYNRKPLKKSEIFGRITFKNHSTLQIYMETQTKNQLFSGSIYFWRYVRKLKTNRDPDHDFGHLPCHAKLVLEIILEEDFYVPPLNREEITIITDKRLINSCGNYNGFAKRIQKASENHKINIIFNGNSDIDDKKLSELKNNENISVKTMDYNEDLLSLVICGKNYLAILPEKKAMKMNSEMPFQFGFHEQDYASRIRTYLKQNLTAA